MAFSNYSELKQEIIDWSHRDDLDLKIDSFIDLAEAEMLSNRVEPIKIIGQDTLATDTLDSVTPSRFLALPTGFMSHRNLRIIRANTRPHKLTFMTPEQMSISDVAGLPSYFTVTDQIEFEREPDEDYTIEIQYIKDFVALSDANTTNEVLTNNPNIYLFGALWALYKHAVEEQLAAQYYSDFIQAIVGANTRADMGRYGPSPTQTVSGMTP
jgi:hypothetical protein